MNTPILFGVGGVVIGFVLATAFTSTMFSEFRNSGVGMMGNNQNIGDTKMAGSIEEHFIEQMVPHHDGAVAMAKLALEKSKRPEIKTLANAIIGGQTKEIQDMRSWHKNWFRTNVSERNTAMMGGRMMSGNGMHMGGQEDMTALENAADFDRVFIKQMIPHHQLAIMMAQMLKAGTVRPEMLLLADNIIESQSREIQEMQGWHKEWYQ